MPADRLHVGLDLGTSGARAVVIDGEARERASGRAAMEDHGSDLRDPATWWGAASAALGAALAGVDRAAVCTLAVDGTSGTMVATDAAGRPLAPGLMYNDACTDRAILDAIDRAAPPASAARGATSGLARAIGLARHAPARLLHQADWIAFRLCGVAFTDANNALKTGYDPEAGRWPDWIAGTGLDMGLLPPAFEPGQAVAPLTPDAAEAFGLPRACRIVAGTTDGCASFLATGAAEPGDGVTALGTTLTVKLLSDRPINAPGYGIYSHRLLGRWLAGGASNSGGAALLAHFAAGEIEALSARIDPGTTSGLDYYPLPGTGERFPVADPGMAPRTTPRPADDATFLQGLLEGIAGIEALAYRRLRELGAPPLRSVRSVGGGARNGAWSRIRARLLEVPMPAARSAEAAYGAALLARIGAGE